MSGPHRLFATPFASVYPLYLAKVQKKGRTQAELDQVILWLTGFEAEELQGHLKAGTPLEAFFAQARMHPKADAIQGVVCGVRVETVEDPTMRKIRMLDKLVDELAKGKALEKVMRR